MTSQAKICNKCSEAGKWYPTVSISKLEELLSNFLKTHGDIKSIKALRKNIAYNLQYIEFQIKMQEEFKTTDVILTQNWKMTILTGMSIIETILYYLLISKDLYKKTNYGEKPIVKIESEKTINGNFLKIQNLIYTKDEERLEKISFKKMIDIAQRNNLLGSGSSEIYKQLNYLIKLRNKIHLYLSTNDTDTDYMKIKNEDLSTLKMVLHSFMMSSLFSLSLDQKKLFDYLKISEKKEIDFKNLYKNPHLWCRVEDTG